MTKISVHNATELQYELLVDAGLDETVRDGVSWVDIEVGDVELTVFKPMRSNDVD